MKLPWVRKYIVIAFHVVVTFFAVYLIKTIIDMGGFFIMNLHGLLSKAIYVVLKAMSVFSVIITAFIIFYVLDPLVDFFQRSWNKLVNKKETKRRTAGTALMFILFASIVAFLFAMGFKKFGNQKITPIYAIDKSIEKFSKSYSDFKIFVYKSGLSKYIMPLIDFFADKIIELANKIGRAIFDTAVSAGTSIADIIASIAVSFYFLRDKYIIAEYIKDMSGAILPKKIYNSVSAFLNNTNNIFAGYIRGQLTDATIMAVLISCILSILGVDFPIIIGIISGYSNIIPYFGAIVGFVLSVGVSVISGGASKALLTGIAMIILQQTDSLIIVPRIVGDRVSLSPMLVIISLTVFGKIFGIIGMIFAVPVFAIIKLYVNNAVFRK